MVNVGNWQALLAPESRELMTYTILLGRLNFLRLPFGISTVPEFFQKKMPRILEGVPGQAWHMDEVLVFGTKRQEYNINLK